MVPFSFEQ